MADFPAPSIGSMRLPSQREQELIADAIREWNEMIQQRFVWAAQWEEAAQLIWPEHKNTFQFGDFNWQGQKKTERQIDSKGMLALNTFSAVVDSLISPANQIYQQLRADNDYVMKDRQTALWFERATKTLFKYRYSPYSNFAAANYVSIKSLGAFGNRGVLIEQLDATQFGGVRELRFRNIPLGELYFHENHQGIIDGYIRAFRMTPRQIMQRFKDNFPAALESALNAKSETLYYVLHRVCSSQDHDPQALDRRRMPWHSMFIFSGQGYGGATVSQGNAVLLEEGGYHSFPMAISRYEVAPMETYGRGPAQFVLPTLKTKNSMKQTYYKTVHRGADPVFLTSDDGLADSFDWTPGAMNKGGVTADGKPLVITMPNGDVQVSVEMLQMDDQIIDTAFLGNVFQILTETPTMTATEVIERVNEKGMLLAPTVGRQQSEHLGPQTHRELDLLVRMGALPPLPPRLREAGGEYQIVYTSPMAKAARAGAAAGFMRTLETVKEVVAVTQDPSPLDVFAFDRAVPEIADISGVYPSWMASPDEIAQKRKNRAQAAARQQQVQELPAKAAMIKAQAVAQKNGAGQQGPPTAPAVNPGPSPMGG